jgi:two-component system, LytTR family, response regulator
MRRRTEQSGEPSGAVWRLVIAHPNPGPIKRIIADLPRFEVIDESSSSSDGLARAQQHAADVLVLGINNPHAPELDVANRNASPVLPLIIALSPADASAAALYDRGVFDFTVDGSLPERLRLALAHADQWLERIATSAALRAGVKSRHQPPNAATDRERYVALVTPRRALLFRPFEIDWAEASAGRVTVCAKSRQYPVQETLAQFAARLPDSLFVRLRRSTIVNLHCIQAVESRGHGELRVLLKGGRRIDVGTTYRDRIEHLVARP